MNACASCRWWHCPDGHSWGELTAGECRRYPHYVIRAARDWCGEHLLLDHVNVTIESAVTMTNGPYD